jgi:hypothetical protein
MKRCFLFLLLVGLLWPASPSAQNRSCRLFTFDADQMFNKYLLRQVYEQYLERDAFFCSGFSAAEAREYGNKAKQVYVDLLGPMPNRTAVAVEHCGSHNFGAFSLEKIIYQSSPNRRVTANLYLPGQAGKHPVVLMLCGHGAQGKAPQWDKTYRTLMEPLFEDMPVVVLTNTLSASSSEIVAGALQDLDRAVILGSRTFGKGLVQTTRELAYNGVLKVTTAKYYIPSGRCIQAVNYANGRSGRLPDSLTTQFSTRNGRPVRDGGGISPDVSCVQKEYSDFCWQLVNNLYFFDFANDYYRKHPKITSVENFKLSEQDFNDFKNHIRNSDFRYELHSKSKLNELKKTLESEGYWEDVSDDFKSLESKLVHDLDKDLETFRPDIERILSLEIIRRYYYQKGEIQESLKTDECVSKALDLLMNRESYKAILQPSKQQAAL